VKTHWKLYLIMKCKLLKGQRECRSPIFESQENCVMCQRKQKAMSGVEMERLVGMKVERKR